MYWMCERGNGTIMIEEEYHEKAERLWEAQFEEDWKERKYQEQQAQADSDNQRQDEIATMESYYQDMVKDYGSMQAEMDNAAAEAEAQAQYEDEQGRYEE
jgi:hypothetical protein